jgi:hypothetical protein
MAATSEPKRTTEQTGSILTEEQARNLVDPHIKLMLKWYWNEAEKWERWAWRLQIGVLAMSTLVTIVAALPVAADLGSQEWRKWCVVLISALTTLVSGLLSKSGIERTAQLREQGRIKLETLSQKAILRLTKKSMTEEERLALMERLIDGAEDVEQRYGVHPVAAGKGHGSGGAPHSSGA